MTIVNLDDYRPHVVIHDERNNIIHVIPRVIFEDFIEKRISLEQMICSIYGLESILSIIICEWLICLD